MSVTESVLRSHGRSCYSVTESVLEMDGPLTAGLEGEFQKVEAEEITAVQGMFAILTCHIGDQAVASDQIRCNQLLLSDLARANS